LRKLARKRYQVNVHVVEPSVHTGHFAETIQTCPDDLSSEGYLLHFGTLSRLKGTDRLIDLLPRLIKAIPEIRLVFIGRGKRDPQDNHYHDLIRQRCPQDAARITVLDAVPHRELFRYVAHARLVVLPSRIDNLPNTCLESMALKRVVVATQDASFEQLIDHQSNGFLTPQDNNDALAEQIQHAWNLSATERAHIGAAANNTIQRLAPERTIGTLIHLFEQAAGCVQTSSPRLRVSSDSD
jgi:glycosyltransferase involved in cell wall biosynthesis